MGSPRKLLLAGLVLLLVGSLLGLLGGNGGPVQPLREALLGRRDSAPIQSASATGVIAVYQARQTPTPTPSPPTFRVTEPLRGGNWQYEVFLVKRLDRIGSVRPRGEFLLAYIELTNVGTRNFGIGFHDFEMVGVTNTYQVDTSSRVLGLYGNEFRLISSIENYPPGVPFSTVLVFDINPAETTLWLLPKQAGGARVLLECAHLGCTRK